MVTNVKGRKMKHFTVSAKSNGKKVIRAAILEFPNLTPASLQKALKHKDIRINGKRISSDTIVSEGDNVEIWLPDAMFEQKAEPVKPAFEDYKVVFESDDLLLVNKRQGLAVHGGKGMSGDCLIDILRKDYHDPQMDLCHRIDMNTGGLILLAKNKKSLEDAIALFKSDLITKRYRCLVRGVPKVGETVICKDEAIMKEVSAYLENRQPEMFSSTISQKTVIFRSLPVTAFWRSFPVSVPTAKTFPISKSSSSRAARTRSVPSLPTSVIRSSVTATTEETSTIFTLRILRAERSAISSSLRPRFFSARSRKEICIPA